MSEERILDKIKKCLALSKSSNENEAAGVAGQAESPLQAGVPFP